MQDISPDDVERYLIGQIEEIQRRAQRDAEPYVKRLTELRNTRPPAPFIVCAKCHRPVPVGIACPSCTT